jgi:hypothetical protein
MLTFTSSRTRKDTELDSVNLSPFSSHDLALFRRGFLPSVPNGDATDGVAFLSLSSGRKTTQG